MFRNGSQPLSGGPLALVGAGAATLGGIGPICVMNPILALATFRPDYVRCRPNRSPEYWDETQPGRETVGSPRLHSMCSSLDDWAKCWASAHLRRQALPEIFAKRPVDSLP